MKIIDKIKDKKPSIAFEIFPPKPDVPLESIYASLEQFKALKPDYISVTYGAGGSRRGRTLEIASRLKYEYGVEAMAHFTCVDHSREEIDEILDELHEKKLENILALRGDPPQDRPCFDFNSGDYKYAYELIRHIRSRNNFCIAAAAYVEGHTDSRRLKEDLYHLKNKVDEGADFLITQFFFDNRLYYDFIDRAEAIGIDVPIIPGIMPVFKADQIKAMAAKCDCSIPARLVLIMDKYSGSPEDMRKAAIEYAAAQISDLLDNGTPGVHIYTMNRPKSTAEILKMVNMVPC